MKIVEVHVELLGKRGVGLSGHLPAVKRFQLDRCLRLWSWVQERQVGSTETWNPGVARKAKPSCGGDTEKVHLRTSGRSSVELAQRPCYLIVYCVYEEGRMVARVGRQGRACCPSRSKDGFSTSKDTRILGRAWWSYTRRAAAPRLPESKNIRTILGGAGASSPQVQDRSGTPNDSTYIHWVSLMSFKVWSHME